MGIMVLKAFWVDPMGWVHVPKAMYKEGLFLMFSFHVGWILCVKGLCFFAKHHPCHINMQRRDSERGNS